MCLFIIFLLGSACLAVKKFFRLPAVKVAGVALFLLLLAYLAHVVWR
jgi:hypothetical protein